MTYVLHSDGNTFDIGGQNSLTTVDYRNCTNLGNSTRSTLITNILNLVNTGISSSLSPNSDNTFNVGTSTHRWGTVYTAAINSGASDLAFTGNLVPSVASSYDLGSVLKNWGSIYGVSGVLGSLSVSTFGTGVLHSNAGGNISSSNVVNSDVDAAAAIAYSKLNLAGSIQNSDVVSTAAVDWSKMAHSLPYFTSSATGVITSTPTTLSAAQLLGGIIRPGDPGGPGTLNLPTAASVITAIGATAYIGMTFPIIITNASIQNWTLATNTGWSLVLASTAVNTLTSHTYFCVITSVASNTMSIYG